MAASAARTGRVSSFTASAVLKASVAYVQKVAWQEPWSCCEGGEVVYLVKLCQLGGYSMFQIETMLMKACEARV